MKQMGKYRHRQIRVIQSLQLKNNTQTEVEFEKCGRKQLTAMISFLRTKPTREQFKAILTKLTYRTNPNSISRFRHSKNEHLTYERALELVGGLSTPDKMPCYSYNLPASACITGAKLAKIEGTPCHECYAIGGWYKMDWVQERMVKRLKSINKPLWVESFIYLLQYLNQAYFRWHDSGDIQSIEHLDRICQVAWGTYFPENHFINTKHWLPTSEWEFVRIYIEDMKMLIPPNLKIVLSGDKIDQRPPVELAKRLGVYVSMVSTKTYTCPAPDQINKCQSCRKCWDGDVFSVVYKLH